MGNLVFQATLGGQVNLVGPNTASTFNLNVPAVAGTLITSGDSATVTNTMLAGSIANAKLLNSSVTVGSTAIALGATSTTLAGLTGVTTSALTDSGLTSGRVTYASTGGLLADSANLTFNGTTLTTANDLSISGLTVGKGGGAVSDNTSVGYQAGNTNSTGSANTYSGYQAGFTNSTGNANTAFGAGALRLNTTASNNTAVGYQAGYANTVGTNSVFVGYTAGVNSTGTDNAFLGGAAGQANLSGTKNTFIGAYAGSAITTGSANSVIGRYNGNQGGLDIRTASSYIVLSDGDGNPPLYWNGSSWKLGNYTGAPINISLDVYHTTGSASGASFFVSRYNGTQIGDIAQNGTTGVLYNTSSDYRLKDITGPVTAVEAKDFIMALQPKQGTWKTDGSRFVGFVAHEFQEVSPSSVSGVKDAVDEDGNPKMQAMQASSPEVMANLIAFVQELKTIVDTQAAEIAELKAKVA